MSDLSEARSLLKAIAAARVAADVDALMRHFHNDATFHIVGFGEPVEGLAAIRETLDGLIATYKFLVWDLIEIFVEGGAIATRHRLEVKHESNGRIAETQTAEFLTMRDGKCTAFVQFADTALVVAMSQAA